MDTPFSDFCLQSQLTIIDSLKNPELVEEDPGAFSNFPEISVAS